ncbi:CRISPR-associated protein Csx16 [Thiohalobacter sp. IOR34]|uniref:CRISPR-associated protein Csx16 n=1 Tax=Thiohalobacter sp. IOR34 TaxID=3057176 RepID=UPI00339D6525
MSESSRQGVQGDTVLVTFLGTGDYSPVAYRMGTQSVETAHFAYAAATFYEARHVRVLATQEAEDRHGEGMRAAFAGLPGVSLEFHAIPSGKDTDELWRIFDTLIDSLQTDGPVILDITHGFRTLPFFSAAAIAHLRAVGDLSEDFRVVYGAFDASKESGVAPVWELTAFLDLLDWAHGVSVFTTTGLADPLLAAFRAQDSKQRQALAREGGRNFPRTNTLAGALERFSNDFLTLRIAAMVCGDGQEKPRSSARQLLDAIEATGKEAGEFLPALKPLLQRLTNLARGLEAPSLHGPDADQALVTLAKRYLAQKRYAEAAVVVREAWVSRHATSPAQTSAGREGFDEAGRRAAEARWNRDCAEARAVANVRNDIEHGGYRKRPLPGDSIRDQVRTLVENLEQTAREHHTPKSAGDTVGKTWFVSRHPGAVEWAQRQGIAVDNMVDHLDPEQVEAGDTVIGTLPVHLAARICERGARYWHLTLNLTADMRGRELSADDLDAAGARLEAFNIRKD